MRRKRVSKPVIAVVVSLLAVVFSLLGAGTAYAYQTHMLNARDSLGQALNQLQIAVPDKDGHRVNAIDLVQQAINEVNLGIRAGAQ